MQKQEIDIHFDEAQMILLCISPMFLAGYEEEIQRAIKRYERKEAHVIPILFRPVRRKKSPIDKLQVLPDRAKPITKWKDRDEGFENVADGISKVVDQWNLHSLSVSIAERRALMANFDQFTEAVKLQMQPLVRALATATTLQQLSRCIPNGVTFADLVVGWQTLSHASTLEEKSGTTCRRITCSELANIASQFVTDQGNLGQAIKIWHEWICTFKYNNDPRQAAMVSTFTRELTELQGGR